MTECPGRGQLLTIPSGTTKPVATAFAGPAEADPPRPENGSMHYRMLGDKEHGVVSKFRAWRLEEVLNAHSRRGWRPNSAVMIDVSGHGGHHAELVLTPER